MGKKLTEIMKRAAAWPEADRDEAADLLLAIEAERRLVMPIDDADRAALERSAEDVRHGRFASDDAVKELLGRFRR